MMSLPGREMARSTDFMRAPQRATATVNIDPPASSQPIMRGANPHRGENGGPGKDDRGELGTPVTELENL
jgi:hypothetical protein